MGNNRTSGDNSLGNNRTSGDNPWGNNKTTGDNSWGNNKVTGDDPLRNTGTTNGNFPGNGEAAGSASGDNSRGNAAIFDKTADFPSGSENFRGSKILVAEDNELNAEILIDLLEEEGYSVVVAENGLLAANIFSVSAPGEFSHILMDLMMPVMNGFETTEMIRQMTRPDAKTVRIYACTANSSPADRERAKQCGMDDFLTKPINIEKLLELLEK